MQSFEEIEPLAASQRLSSGSDQAIIDVRSVDEFDSGHPSGAWNIPLAKPGAGGMRPNPRFVEAVRARFSSDTALILSCAVGGRSAIACQVLQAEGFLHLSNMRGGMDGARDLYGRKIGEGWAGQGLPVSMAPEAGRSWAEIEAALDAGVQDPPGSA